MNARRCLCLILVTALAEQTSCATRGSSRPETPVAQASLGRIGFVTGREEPDYQFDSLLHGKGHGAGMGAVAGVGACFQALAGNVHAGDDALFVLAWVIVCIPIGAAVGAVIGTTQAAPATSVEDLRGRAQQGLAGLQLNQAALQAGIEYGHSIGLELLPLDRDAGPGALDDTRSYARFAGSVDSVIELNVLNVYTVTTGQEGLPIVFALDARVRVITVPGGQVLDDYVVSYRGESRSADEWLAGDAVAVREELQRGVRSLAIQALDEPLMYRPLARDESHGGWSERVPGYALRTIDPPLRIDAWPPNPFKQLVCGDRYDGGPTYGWLERYPLESRAPLLRWEALPRDFDLVPGDGPGQAQDLRYDLRIFEGSRIAYERLGLSEPSHALEEPLPPCAELRWTVRARFRLDGLSRATEWTGAYNTIGGYVDPAWLRGHSGKPALAAIPGDEALFYPIIRTPGANGEPCECR